MSDYKLQGTFAEALRARREISKSEIYASGYKSLDSVGKKSLINYHIHAGASAEHDDFAHN